MKKYFLLLSCCILLASCGKDPQNTSRTYDFAGRAYERYHNYSFMPNERSYFAVDFLSDTTLLIYNGRDTLDMDSVWHRKDTLAVALLKPYLYRISDCSIQSPDYPPLDYVAEIYCYTRKTYDIHGEHGEYEEMYCLFHVNKDENYIWRTDDLLDYVRVR